MEVKYPLERTIHVDPFFQNTSGVHFLLTRFHNPKTAMSTPTVVGEVQVAVDAKPVLSPVPFKTGWSVEHHSEEKLEGASPIPPSSPPSTSRAEFLSPFQCHPYTAFRTTAGIHRWDATYHAKRLCMCWGLLCICVFAVLWSPSYPFPSVLLFGFPRMLTPLVFSSHSMLPMLLLPSIITKGSLPRRPYSSPYHR